MLMDKVFYTDGHDVVVTDTSFLVKKKQYRIAGITDYALRRIRPLRLEGLLIVFLGALVALLSTLNSISSQVDSVFLFERVWNGSQVLLTIGVLIGLIGVIWILVGKPRYAVHISTAEGERDVVVSSQREYIREIVNALNQAVGARKR